MLIAAFAALGIALIGGVVIVLLLSGVPESPAVITATPVQLNASATHTRPSATPVLSPVIDSDIAPPPSLTPNPFALGTVTFDVSGNFAFPVAADPRQYVWTHYHWDDTNAADIEARSGLSRADFEQLTSVPLVACRSGVVVEWSGSVGGSGYVLQGDDGLDYYYAHMAELWQPDGTRVEAGTPLGLMGNSGNSAQFIEPHLHFAIGPRGTLQTQSALVINVAEWLLNTFGLGWEDRPTAEPPPAQPSGSPLPYAQIAVVTSYAEALAQGLPQPAIELGDPQGVHAAPLDVVATLTGRVNVIRWTDHYGTRIQIANDLSRNTVVISGVGEWFVRDGEIVTQGQVIGRWNPAQRSALHYMLYANNTISDPTTTLISQ